MFDVYDNDNKRNNPTIFVLENAKGPALGVMLCLLSHNSPPPPALSSPLQNHRMEYVHLVDIAGETRFNHDNDYDDDMVKRIPPVVVGNAGQNPDQMMYKSHRCVADFRNVG